MRLAVLAALVALTACGAATYHGHPIENGCYYRDNGIAYVIPDCPPQDYLVK